MESSRSRIDLRRLKSFALEALPKDHPLRDVLLIEHDEMGVNEFLAKLPIWLKLVDIAIMPDDRISRADTVRKMLNYA